MGQLRGEGRRRGRRAAYGRGSLWGQLAVAAVEADGDGDVDAAAGDGEEGDEVGGDAPQEPHCHTACSPGTRTQSEVLLRRH